MKNTTELLETLAQRLKYALIHKKKSQRNLANLTGYSNTAISQYINSQRNPSARAVVNMSECLNISYEWLMFGNGKFEDQYDSDKIYDVGSDDISELSDKSPLEFNATSARVIVRKRPAGGAWLEIYLDKNNFRDLEKQILV
jgi:transcriptional regulator with XRE-family HTH domain